MAIDRKRDDIVPNTSYDPRGWTSEQRDWFRLRDANAKGEPACQFWEMRTSNGLELWVPCQKTRSLVWKMEIHHIYPQGLQKRAPQSYGGNNPYNGITLCSMSGRSTEVGHHDILAPHMIAAKLTYRFDRTSYTRWINNAHDALEAGVSPYVHEWDGMLRAAARVKTDNFLRNNPDKPFPGGSRIWKAK